MRCLLVLCWCAFLPVVSAAAVWLAQSWCGFASLFHAASLVCTLSELVEVKCAHSLCSACPRVCARECAWDASGRACTPPVPCPARACCVCAAPLCFRCGTLPHTRTPLVVMAAASVSSDSVSPPSLAPCHTSATCAAVGSCSDSWCGACPRLPCRAHLWYSNHSCTTTHLP